MAKKPLFPFKSVGFGFAINSEEAASIDEAMINKANNQDLAACNPHTYGDASVEMLVQMFLPGGRGELSAEDVLVDLGAGVAKVMAVASLVTNASSRGIELSAERYKDGCKVLKTLEQVFLDESLQLSLPSGSTKPSGSRLVELWLGDLLDAPKSLMEPQGIGERGALTFFSYANCLPNELLAQMFSDISRNPHQCVRLLTSKVPSGKGRGLKVEGLHRTKCKPAMYTVFKREGDKCREAIDAGEENAPSQAAISLGAIPQKKEL